MAQFTPRDLRSLACASFLLAVYGATLVYRGWRSVCAQGVGSARSSLGCWCSASWRRAVFALRCKRADEEDDPVAQYIARQVEARVVGDLRYILAYGVPLLAALLVIMVLRIIGGVQDTNTESGDVLSFVAFAIFMSLSLCPSALNARTASLFYVVVMSLVTLMLWPAQTPVALLYRSAGNWIWRHLCSVAFQKPMAAAGCQLVYVLLAMLRFSQVSADAESEITALHHFIFEMCAMIVITAFTYQAAISTRYKIGHEVTSTMLKDERSAMSAMLDLLCDVVVELGPDLRLQKGTSKFAALMTFDKNCSPVAGTTLQDFMPLSEDKQNFESCLAGVADTEGGPANAYPGVLHVKLRDALGNHLRVQLFYVRFRYLDKHGFLVGVREDPDMSTFPIPELPSFDLEDRLESKRRKKKTKPSDAPAGRGTPPSMIGQALGSSDEDEDEAQSSFSSSGSSCSGADWTPTLLMGRVVSLTWVMQKWLVEQGEQSCCPWHAAVAAAQESIGSMKKFRCAMEFAPDPTCDHQCKKCGNLVASGDHRRNQQIGANINLTCRHCGGRRFRSIGLQLGAASGRAGVHAAQAGQSSRLAL